MKKRVLSKWIASSALLLTVVGSSTLVAQAEDHTGNYIIGFGETDEAKAFSSGSNEMSAQANEMNIQVEEEYEHVPYLSVELESEEVDSVEALEEVEFVEPDYQVQAFEQAIPPGVENVGALVSHYRGELGAGADVAIIDSGIAAHEDLNVVGGVSFVDSEPSYEDNNGHGTHVAGTVAALDNNHGVLGVSPAANLYAVKVLGSDGMGQNSDIIRGIDWAIENDIDIANLSLGGPTPSQALEDAVNRADNSGVLLVAATGNSGAGSVSYPARYDSVLAVGAVDSSNQKANFSQYGEGLDIVAPGVEIGSTYLGNSYHSLSGTSMASPHVAGVAALLKGQHPWLSNDEIRERLKETATPIGDALYYGSGLVNADAATHY
ncbi:S8 family peptidase [Shouchella shacheensis]|uniref:S8 family peptidase n=1 Tax=Shouchella shacheensis TaxID=1649580 RepID=UPI000740103A|nr:S8 family peptidase [Shouchella shacheensis]